MLPLASTRVFLIIIIVLVIIIPTSSFIIVQRSSVKSPAKSSPTPFASPKEVPKITPIQELEEASEGMAAQSKQQTTPSPSVQISFGSTLNFKTNLEGRPKDDHSAKIFLGIASGQPTNNPTYLLSFLIDMPKSGAFQGLSIAGLTQGSTYTAYLKGPSQIASASAFTVRPTVADLGLFNLITGDLNEDNTINSSDYSIAKAALGATPSSQKWNKNIDFNLDNIINSFDLGIITKNLGKIGSSGVWVSPPPPPATQSGVLEAPNTGSTEGYWLYIPGF